ncbi:MAG: DNA polymerase III subunit beta [Patescibacteria group bacterium]|nr:DNA polymerase III subunit beta [Patescibacteria group bacterium]
MTETITSQKKNVDIEVSLVLDKLKKALSGLERVVSGRSTLPILNNVLIRAQKDGVEISATDLEMGVKFFLGGKVETEGTITVPGKTLSNFVNNLHGDTVSFTSKGNILSLSSGGMNATINGMSADEFPVIPEVEGGKVVEMQTNLFKDLLSQVDFAASFEESRPILTGVYLVADEKTITLVATDSYRLSEVKGEGGLKESFSAVVPVRTLNEIKKVLGDAQKFELRVWENQIMVKTESVTVVSRIIEGEYPNYQQIIPTNSATKVELEVQDLIDTLKTASIFSVEESSSVKLVVSTDGIEVTSQSSQLGSFSSQLPAQVEGEGGEISFNAKYILDGLNSFTTPKCIFEFSGKGSPGVFKPSGVEGRLYIVMPLKS